MTRNLPLRLRNASRPTADLRYRPLPRPLTSSRALAAVSHLRVSAQHPPTSNIETGLDYERCAALHNAIVRYAWDTAGFEPALMPETVWWDAEHNLKHRDEAGAMMHPTVQAFLQLALEVPVHPGALPGGRFHYYAETLVYAECIVDGFYSGFQYDNEPLRIVPLYSTDPEITESAIGVIYDQTRHMCFYNEYDPDILWGIEDDEDDTSHLWHPLETVLTLFIELIEREKFVVLHHTVKRAPTGFGPTTLPDGSREWVSNPPAEQPQQDPVSGARRHDETQEPWTVQPFTKQDLALTLDNWNALLDAIESRLPGHAEPAAQEDVAFTETMLTEAGLPKEHFIWQFLSKTRKPRFTHLGPGLRLVSPDELIHPPHRHIGTLSNVENCPILFLIGSDDQQTRDVWNHHLETRIPWGLYFDEVRDRCLFEDGCKLVLPFPVASRDMELRDGRRYKNNEGLFQLGISNPFILSHAPQLAMILGYFTEFVRSGKWQVGVDGVLDGTDWWKIADTEDEDILKDFFPEVGCGRDWV
ncbi:hypothetical protein BDZ85DRAFT_282043 [Elsinoe ampelina]|uniref:Uncharacterized protein n=1 Tax=Elsinoe ampelina TaxID=302913 RepID=A0A6A6GB98_9PEZI|nr:hypothetical protein BDZ85DRAFT_282043 [Elsinoe ampelina]